MTEMDTAPAVAVLAEESGAPPFRLDAERPLGGWAVLAGAQVWIWAAGLRTLQPDGAGDPFTYEAWVTDGAGTPRSLGALGPAPGGAALACFRLDGDRAGVAALLVTAQVRGATRPAAVVLAGRVQRPQAGGADPPAEAPQSPEEEPARPAPASEPEPAPTPAEVAQPPAGEPAAPPVLDPAPRPAGEPAPAHLPWPGPGLWVEDPLLNGIPAAPPADPAGLLRPLAGAGADAALLHPPAPSPAPSGQASPPPPAAAPADQPPPAAAPPCPPGHVPLDRVVLQLEPHPILRGHGSGSAQLDFAAGGLLITLRGLPPAESLGQSGHTGRPFNAFRVWLQAADTRQVLAAGIAARVWTDTWRLHVRGGLPLQQYDSVLVTAEDRAGSGGFPAGPVLLSGPYRWYGAGGDSGDGRPR